MGVDVTETHVTAELFDQAMARLARKRVSALESAPELVVEQVLDVVAAVRQQVYEAPVGARGDGVSGGLRRGGRAGAHVPAR
jgi:predicted nuclease with RNAse H fold